jgi:hypothetical protein
VVDCRHGSGRHEVVVVPPEDVPVRDDEKLSPGL